MLLKLELEVLPEVGQVLVVVESEEVAFMVVSDAVGAAAPVKQTRPCPPAHVYKQDTSPFSRSYLVGPGASMYVLQYLVTF